jgi:membrane protease YdiL (CAAX protease family)
MKTDQFNKIEWWERILLSAFFIITGSIILIVFSPWSPLLDPVYDYLGRIALILLLWALVFLTRKSTALKKYWQVLFGLLVLIIAVSLDWMIGKYLIVYVGLTDTTPSGWALQKLNEFAVIVSVIIILTKLSQKDLSTIYIQKGNLKLGLLIGSIAFILAAAGSIPMAALFNAQNLSITRIIPWIPWILIFVFANSAMEEIMFRGLFLKKLEPFFGKLFSNLMVAFVFTVLHRAASYTSDQYIFLAILLPLALAWGYIMQKTDAVWGSILFHAGMDIPIILGIFSNL